MVDFRTLSPQCIAVYSLKEFYPDREGAVATMTLVGRILSTGMQGTDVRRLHDALERLDFLIPPTERSNALFGPGTKKAVQDIQRKHFQFASRVNGMVDQITANLISTEVGRHVA